MRVRNSLINISTGIGSQVIITALGFVSRSVFIFTLGAEYYGINALFANVLVMLGLAEAGIGSAIIYSLYKPVAVNDQEKIKVLMKFYKQAFRMIALAVCVLGVSMMPFLQFFVKETNVDNLYLIYGIFLLNTALSYLFANKISFLNVCQKGYIVTGIFTVSSVLTIGIRIAILIHTQNYIFYLLSETVITLLFSLVLSGIVNRMYPFLQEKPTGVLDPETKSTIFKNVKAIIFHKIGGRLGAGTDNIIISSFIGVTTVGLYSNYYMLLEIFRNLINQVFNNMNHSVGHLVAKESDDKIYSIFKVTMLLNFWLYALFSIILYHTIEPLILLWLGPAFIMGREVLIILIVNFYVLGMRRSALMVKTTAGIFHEDRFAPLLEAAINVGISILLVQTAGIAGVFIGTLVGTLLVSFWNTPYLVYKKVFHKPVIHYFMIFGYYTLIGVLSLVMTSLVCSLIPHGGWVPLVLRGMASLLVPSFIFITFFHRTEEFAYLLQIVKRLIWNKIKLKAVFYHERT